MKHLYLSLLLVVLFCSPSAVAEDSSPGGDPSLQTQQLQAELKKVQHQHMKAKKEISLRGAAVDVQQKRIAELEQQLAATQKQLAAEAKALKQAQTAHTEAEQQLAAVTAELKKHEHADSLLAAAQKLQHKALAAEQHHQKLVQQQTELKKQLFLAKQQQDQAGASLKTAQEELPKTTEELKKHRTALEAAGREVDLARLAAEDARQKHRDAQAAVLPERVRSKKATDALAELRASVKVLEDTLAEMRQAATVAGTDPDQVGKELVESIAAAKPATARAVEVVAAADARLVAAEKQVEAADKSLQDALAKLRTTQDAYAQASRTHFQQQLAVADQQNAIRLHEKQLADARQREEQLVARQKELEPKIAAARADIQKLNDEYVDQQRLAEQAMEPLGRFVSFSRHVAPIFAKRCLACHNTRTAKGRLNMDSFAAIMKGGESGSSFDGHDPDSSILFAMVEDGSMPKDADPLTKDELQILRKWIAAGTPLDAGVAETADLFQVMPEVPQPLPPKTYRVPIPVTATAFHPEGRLLASSGYHEVLLWDTDENKLVRRITNVAERVYDLEFNADGTQLIVAAGTPGQLGEVKLFSTARGEHLKTLVRTKDAVFAAGYSPDGTQVAAGGADRVIYVADVASGDTKQQIEDHADWVMDVNWSPDGKRLVSASRDKTVKVYDVAKGSSVITFNGHGDAVYAAVFAQDGKSVVSAGSDRQLRIWNVADAKETKKIGGFGADIFRLQVTPENHLLSASADRNVHQHNLADGKLIRKLAGHQDWVYTLSYNPKRKLVATGSYDGEIRIWNSEDGSVAQSFIAVPQAAKSESVAAAD